MQINDLIKLADLLDANGEHTAADEIDQLILRVASEEGVVISPETLQEMRDSVDKMNGNLEDTIEFLKSQGYEVTVPDAPAAPSEMPQAADDVDSAASLVPVFERLASVADSLDAVGALEEASIIDTFIQKHAEGVYDVVDWKEEEDTAQSKRYDSKHHHNLLVREPKRDQERVDLEGRKEHHVSTYKSSESHSLSTRYSPDLVGVQLGRVGEGLWQCPITGKVYSWETGFTDMDGNDHPGGSVAAQTPDSSGYGIPHRIFDTRENTTNEIG